MDKTIREMVIFHSSRLERGYTIELRPREYEWGETRHSHHGKPETGFSKVLGVKWD